MPKQTPEEKPGRGWAWKFNDGRIANWAEIDEKTLIDTAAFIPKTAKPVRVYITTKKPQ